MGFFSKQYNPAVKATTGVAGLPFQAPKMSPLWALAPLILGLGAGAIAKEPLMGLAAGAGGSVGALMNLGKYNMENQAYADMAQQKYNQEQQAKQEAGKARRATSSFAGIPDNIAELLAGATKEDYAAAIKMAQDRAAAEQASKMAQVSGWPANMPLDQGSTGSEQYGAAPPSAFSSAALGDQMRFAGQMRQLPTLGQVSAAQNGRMPNQTPTGNSMVEQQVGNAYPNQAAVAGGNLIKNRFATDTYGYRVKEALANTRGKTANATMAEQKAAVNPQILQGQIAGQQLGNTAKAQGIQQNAALFPGKIQQQNLSLQKGNLGLGKVQDEAQQYQALNKYHSAAKYAQTKIKDPDLLQAELARLQLMYLLPYMSQDEIAKYKEIIKNARIKAKTNLTPRQPAVQGFGYSQLQSN
jgi:hypothetical protein